MSSLSTLFSNLSRVEIAILAIFYFFFNNAFILVQPKGLSLGGDNPMINITVEDLEMNDGSEEKPYFMNKRLMKLMGKKNKQLKEPRKSHPAPKQMSSENIVLQEGCETFFVPTKI